MEDQASKENQEIKRTDAPENGEKIGDLLKLDFAATLAVDPKKRRHSFTPVSSAKDGSGRGDDSGPGSNFSNALLELSKHSSPRHS